MDQIDSIHTTTTNNGARAVSISSTSARGSVAVLEQRPRPENPERRREARRDRECHRGHVGDRGKLRHHKRLFGMRAGEILQVIDVRKGTLNNVITFPPDGVFFVRSDIDISSLQRVNFKFTSTVLRGSNWEIPLPPFGQGWFENVYMDGDIRVAKGHKRGLLSC
ncbi:BnaC02g09640D [Brassica napus]|uniref:BnaC02g09640D protein n=1 Tax=Brassica napus TaxID=3708 RepID=A0A078HFV8_BRANA|nr:BnaC02g09640D [Brassica napus]